MPRHTTFPRSAQLPSWFANRIQDFLSGAASDLRLRRKSNTEVEVPVREPLGIVALPIQGRWRFNEVAVSRAVPGNGTYTVWAVAEDNDVVDTPLPHTDNTNYAFDLRLTTGAAPSGTGVEVYEAIGTVVVSGGVITSLKQTAGSVSGALLEDGAIASGSQVVATRQPDGSVLLDLADDSVGSAELADNSVGAAQIAPNAVGASELADDAVDRAALGADAVGADELDEEVITNSHLALALADALGVGPPLGFRYGASERTSIQSYDAQVFYTIPGGPAVAIIPPEDGGILLYYAETDIRKVGGSSATAGIYADGLDDPNTADQFAAAVDSTYSYRRMVSGNDSGVTDKGGSLSARILPAGTPSFVLRMIGSSGSGTTGYVRNSRLYAWVRGFDS